MTNYTAKILNNSVSALNAQQAVLAATANNIANVNTPGYARRTIELQTRSSRSFSSGSDVGSGVQIGGVKRIVDNYLEKLVRDTAGQKESAKIQDDLLNRIQSYFTLDGSRETIGSTLTGFFKAVDDLALNPSSLELRSNLIGKIEDLALTIKSTFTGIANLQTEIDQRIPTEIQTVNNLTAQIAELNSRIAAKEGEVGVTAADERDRREQLMQDLSKKIGFSSVETGDGTVILTLSNGFPLVAGTTNREISVTTTPSFATGGQPPSLSGGVLSHIVYDYDPGSGRADLNLTDAIKEGDGTLGGLLKIRGTNSISNTSPYEADGQLVTIAKEVETLARTLLTDVNRSYLGADENANPSDEHQASSADLDGNPPAVYGLFDFDYSGQKDVNGAVVGTGNGLPDDLDLLDPPVYSFASIIKCAITDPRRIAAARDLDPAINSTSFAPGDASNMAAISDLRTEEYSFSFNGFTFTGTFDELYNHSVTYMANEKTRSASNALITEQRNLAAQGQRDEVSGVSLDEEFTNLVRYQRAFQASARLLRLADELLQQIVEIV